MEDEWCASSAIFVAEVGCEKDRKHGKEVRWCCKCLGVKRGETHCRKNCREEYRDAAEGEVYGKEEGGEEVGFGV